MSGSTRFHSSGESRFTRGHSRPRWSSDASRRWVRARGTAWAVAGGDANPRVGRGGAEHLQDPTGPRGVNQQRLVTGRSTPSTFADRPAASGRTRKYAVRLYDEPVPCTVPSPSGRLRTARCPMCRAATLCCRGFCHRQAPKRRHWRRRQRCRRRTTRGVSGRRRSLHHALRPDYSASRCVRSPRGRAS